MSHLYSLSTTTGEMEMRRITKLCFCAPLPGPFRPKVLSVPAAQRTKRPPNRLESALFPFPSPSDRTRKFFLSSQIYPNLAVMSANNTKTSLNTVPDINDVPIGDLFTSTPADVRRHIMFAGLGINGPRSSSDISAAIILHF